MKLRLFILLALTCAISSPVFADTLPSGRDESLQTPVTRTPQEKRLSDLVCWQGGQKVIDEPGIHNFMFGQDMVYGDRADGSRVVFLNMDGNSGTICRLIEHENALP